MPRYKKSRDGYEEDSFIASDYGSALSDGDFTTSSSENHNDGSDTASGEEELKTNASVKWSRKGRPSPLDSDKDSDEEELEGTRSAEYSRKRKPAAL